MPRQSRTRSSYQVVVERRTYVFRLRQAGATFLDILRTIRQDATWHGRLPPSYNERHVHRDVLREIQRLRTDLQELVDDVRQQELARLDRLMLAYWQRAIGDTQRHIPADLEAARFLLQLMARRARYVPGLEVPERIAPTTPDGTQPWEPTVIYLPSKAPTAEQWQEDVKHLDPSRNGHLVADSDE